MSEHSDKKCVACPQCGWIKGTPLRECGWSGKPCPYPTQCHTTKCIQFSADTGANSNLIPRRF